MLKHRNPLQMYGNSVSSHKRLMGTKRRKVALSVSRISNCAESCSIMTLYTIIVENLRFHRGSLIHTLQACVKSCVARGRGDGKGEEEPTLDKKGRTLPPLRLYINNFMHPGSGGLVGRFAPYSSK
jgi:hypothetical protein